LFSAPALAPPPNPRPRKSPVAPPSPAADLDAPLTFSAKEHTADHSAQRSAEDHPASHADNPADSPENSPATADEDAAHDPSPDLGNLLPIPAPTASRSRLFLLAAALILVLLTGVAYQKGLFGDWFASRAVTAATSAPSPIRLPKPAARAVATDRSPSAPESSPAPDADQAASNSASAAKDSAPADQTRNTQPATQKPAAEDRSRRAFAAGSSPRKDGAMPADASADGYEPPKLLKSVNATPPPESVQSFVTGDVKFDAIVDATGAVSSATVLSGPAPLHSAALDALHRYTFKPATKNNQPVPAHVTVSVKFWYEP
jgi:protein TonB